MELQSSKEGTRSLFPLILAIDRKDSLSSHFYCPTVLPSSCYSILRCARCAVFCPSMQLTYEIASSASLLFPPIHARHATMRLGHARQSVRDTHAAGSPMNKGLDPQLTNAALLPSFSSFLFPRSHAGMHHRIGQRGDGDAVGGLHHYRGLAGLILRIILLLHCPRCSTPPKVLVRCFSPFYLQT